MKITSEQLDRKIYEGVKKSLEGIGGKWKGGKVGGFVFAHDPTELLESVQSGEKRNLKKEYQFFPTPAAIADRLVELAELAEGMSILEPSAGDGAIVDAIQRKMPDHTVYVCEINPIHAKLLQAKKWVQLVADDFMSLWEYAGARKYHRIIANPPFSKNQDIDHVLRMYEHLKAGGRLVSIVSNHWRESTNRKETEFREWLATKKHTQVELPMGTFKESGTSIATTILVIDRLLA